MTLMRRFLLARHALGALTEGGVLPKVAGAAAMIIVVCALVTAVMRSSVLSFAALFFMVGFCAYLIWTIEPAVRNLDAMILQLVRLELGGHGLIIDYERPNGRTFLSGEVRVENMTGCEIRLRNYHFEQVGIDSPGAAPMQLQSPESNCDEIVPHAEARAIKLERQEFFGGREGLDDAACVPMRLTLSVGFEIQDEHISAPARRTFQCYALVRAAPRDQRLMP
jgi:hypothetical protein